MPTKSQILKKPDPEAHEKAVKEIDEIVGRLQVKLEDFRAQIQAKREGGTIQEAKMSSKAYLDQLFSSRNEWNAEAGRLRAERNALYAKVDELRAEQDRVKPRIRFFDQTEIANHIRGLQEKQEHTSLSLNEEKRVVAEIKELEQSKPVVALFHDRKLQLDKYNETLRGLKARLGEVSAKSDDATGKINEIKSQLQESIEKHKSEIPILVEQRRDLENKIAEYKDKKTQLIKEFNVEDHAYNEQQRLIKQIKFVTEMKKKLVEQAERRKFAQEREKEEQENKVHPYGAEIAQCDAFTAYLTSLMPKESSSVVAPTQSVQLEEEEGMVLLNKKDKDAQVSAQWFKGDGPKQKKERKKRGAATAPTLQMSVDMLRFLSSQGIKVPTGTEDLQPTIDAITAIRTKWANADHKVEEVKEVKKREAKTTELPDEMDFPEPQISEVVVTHGLFKAEEAEERKDRPYTAPDSKAVRGGRGRGFRGPRGARRGRAPRGDRGSREAVAPTTAEPEAAAE
jgi:uncharacterized coiled-coil DUF342 family protein